MTADTKQWGAAIAVNGVRPAWLGDEVQVRWSHVFIGSGETVAQKLAWTSIRYIRLPADHFAYKALAAGFEPWGGGDKAPEDYDGKEVLLRTGLTLRLAPLDWRHFGNPTDIIGYRKRTDATPDRDPALWDRMVDTLREALRSFEARDEADAGEEAFVERLRAIVAELAPPVDPDLIEAREIAAALAKPNAFITFSAGERSADLIRAGHMDGDLLVMGMLAGIKRGRQLAGEAA